MRIGAMLVMLIATVSPAPAIECPDGAVLENEPPLVDGYIDQHNGGCDTLPEGADPLFQSLDRGWFCGETGWYNVDGEFHRDTDWFLVEFPEADFLGIYGWAEEPTYLFVRTPDCEAPLVIESVWLVEEQAHTLYYEGALGENVWVWIAPPAYAAPAWSMTWNYQVRFVAVTPVEEPTWSSVKQMFD